MHRSDSPSISSEISYASEKFNSCLHFYARNSFTERDSYIANKIDGINIDNILFHLNNVAKIRNPEISVKNLNQTACYIKTILNKYEVPSRVENFVFKQVPGVVFKNVFGDKKGNSAGKVLILSSHYDSHKKSPGADDNASSVASMLEIARIVSKLKTEYTLILAFFTLEEYSMIGSYYHVNNLKNYNYKRIIGSISLDGMGYVTEASNSQKKFKNTNYPISDKGNFLGLIGNTNSKLLLKLFDYNTGKYLPDLKTETLLVKGNGLDIPDSRRSDHTAFWDNGYRAIMVTDTCQFRNPYVHTKEDTTDKLDVRFLENSTKAVLASVLDICLKR